MALNRLKACGGLQPVPEESAASGTTAGANPDATAAAAALPVNLLEHCVKNADGTNPNNAGVTTGRSLRRWCSEDAATERPPPDNVPEKEFRIWFPRAEVSHEDSTDRTSSDWRTFREYRYTECSRAGRLEKTLSVDEVYKNKDSPGILAAAVHQPTSAFHCVSCSSKDEDKGGSLGEEGDGRCRMLSSTKSELFREHRGQVLSRLIDDDFSTWERSPQPLETWKPKLSLDPGTDETGRWEKEARTSSVCQTNTEKVAFEGDDFAKKRRSSDVPSSDVGGLSSTPASRSLSDGDVKSGSHLSVSAGVRDASLVSVDDEFDDSKCTYVKVDSVDSEVEDESDMEGRETVIGAPSPDELGYIAEEPEDEADETTGISEVQKSFSTTTSVAAKTESSSVLSSATECRHQESLSSKLDAKESSKADEKGSGLQFNGHTLDAAARLTADLDALVDGKSLKCHNEDSKGCELVNENVRRTSHEQEEQKDRADAAPRLDDVSDAETNESDTKSMESVISVKGGAVILPNTNGQSTEVELADTIARSANGKGKSLDTVEMFGTSDRLNQELILNETVNITKSTDVAKSQHASVLDSESTSSTDVFHHETCRAENKSDQFSVHAGDLQGAKHAHKDLTESLDSIARKNERVFGEASLSRREELRNFEGSHELTKDAAAHILHVSESIEEALNTTSKTVVRSVTSKCTLNNEQEASVQIVKEHTSTVDECNRNESGPSTSELPERSSIEAPGLKQDEFSQLLKAGTLTEESAFESVTRLTSVDEVSEKTQESVTSITDDSLLSRDVASTNKASAGKDGGQRENPDASRCVKNGVEKILEIGDVLKQDTYRSTEMRFLSNTEVEAQNILMCFTDDEEPWKQTPKTVSSIPNDSPSRKSVLDDDVTADVKNRDEHLGDKGIREFREHVIERFDNLALKNSRGFQAESVSVLDHSQVPNASPNKIQDSGGIVEKGSVAGNEENIPTILADEHHLFKEPAISSVEGQEGTGVMSTVTSSVHEESSLSSSIKVSMLKDVIALNRTDDETSVDDVSLQDDNDQGFESLPCDQTLDSEDLNDEQVRDESDDAKNVPPADNHSNKSADKLTALLDELGGPEKASPISLQHEIAAQTSSTEATDQENEVFPELDLRSSKSKDDVDNEGTSVESCVNGSELDEKLHHLSATSSEIEHEKTKLQSSERNSGEGDSAVTGRHNITEIAGRNGDSEDIYVEGIEENTTKTADPHSIDTSTSQQNLREKEEEAGAQDETSEELASEHSGNRTTGDDKIGQVVDDTSVNGSQKNAESIESSEVNEILEDLVTEKHVSWSSSDEIIELKEEHFMKESTAISSQHESSLRRKTSEGLPSEESVNESTSDSEIVKLDAGPSQTKLPSIAVPDEENVRKETSEESGRGRTTHPRSSDVEVTELKTLVEEISELVDSGATVPNEVSDGSEGGPPWSQSTITEITVIKADTPVSEISETIVPNDMSMRGELIEVCADKEPPNQSTGNKDVTKVGEEALTELMSNDLRTLSKDPDAVASAKSVAQIADDERATNFEADFSVSEFPEMAVSNELRVQSETLDVLASEELANKRNTNVDVTDVKAEMSGGEVPEIVVITEASEISETSEASASEATANESTNEQITKVEPHRAVCELSEIAFSIESSTQSKAPHVLASEESGNHDNITIDVTKVGEDVSVGEVAVTEASTKYIELKETAEEPAGNAPVDHSTNEKITGAEQDTSVCELPDEAFSGKMSAQSKASDLLASDEPGNHEKVNIDATKENAEMSGGDVPDIAASAGPFERNGKPEQPASETPVDESSNDEITRAQQDTSAFEWPGRAFSSKLSVQVKTSDAIASEEPINDSADKHVVTNDNAKTLVSQVPEILVSYEPNVENTYDELVNGETPCPGASDTEFTKETSFGEVQGTVVSTDASALCERPKESASESPVNQNNKEELNMSESGASVGESPATAAFNEASLQSKSSGQSSSEETRDHADDDNWNTNPEIDISVKELSEIVASNETTTHSKSPEESASGEATHQSIADDAVEMKEGTTASKFSVFAIIDDASLQKISGKGECEESAKESGGDNDVIKVMAETSNELPDIRVRNVECVKDNTSDDSTSEKPVNQNTSNEQIAKVDARTLEGESTNITVCDEVIIQSRITEKLTGGEVLLQNVGHDNNEVEEQISSNVLRDVAAPDKDNVQSKTSEEPEVAAVENKDPNGVAITEAKSEAVDSGWSDILPPNEDLTLNAAAKESASEEILHGTKSDVEITTVKENMTISKVPEINMPGEPILRSESPPELKSDAGVNESIIIKDTTDVKAGRSVKETPVFATPNEASVEIGVTEERTSKGNSPRMNIDNEHAETKSEISASVLPEIAEPDHQNVQTSAELSSEEPVTGNANESHSTGVTPGTSADKFLESGETTKGPGFDDPNNSRSEVAEACIESETKEDTNQSIVVDGITAQEQVEAALECRSLKSNMSKRFANADSCDELDEDNETASTGAESVESDTIELVRSDDETPGVSIEEVDKDFKDITRGSLEDISRERVQINDSRDSHALNNQEQNIVEDAHEASAEEESLNHLADDTKKPSRHTSTSEGSVLETVPAEFMRETTEDHHTTELANGSEAVSNSLLGEEDGGTSEAPSKGGYARTPEPEKSSCEGTEGRVAAPEQFATDELANVVDEFEVPTRLTSTRSEVEKGDALDPEISASHNIVATMPSTAEVYNLTMTGSSVNYHFSQETQDDRSSLLAYAEEVVSTVLSMCITYLEENDQEWRTVELAGMNRWESNADVERTTEEKGIKTTSGNDSEEYKITLPHSDFANKRSSGGDPFEPIVSRQSVFEEAEPLADHQYVNNNRDPNEAVIIAPVRAEEARSPDEVLNSPLISEKQDEVGGGGGGDVATGGTGKTDETATSCKTAENVETGVALNSAEDAGLSQVTEEHHDGDASDNSASISEALTEDAGSSETHSSTSGANRNQLPDQAVVQSDQSEETRREEEKPVVARVLDAASSDSPAEMSETRRNFVESGKKDDSEEPEHSIVMTAPLRNQESQLHEDSFTESAARVSGKCSERSASEIEARRGDDSKEKEEAEHETAANSFSESSVTTVSVKTEDSGKSLSEYSTRTSKQESDTAPANEANKDNNGTSSACEADVENVPNNELNETRSLDAQHTVADSNNNTPEGREETASQVEVFQESSGRSDIPQNAEDGHQDWDIREEEAKKTIVPDSHDASSQDVYTEVAVNNEENNKSNELCTDTYYDGSARQNDRYVFKHESSTVVDNDMESLGALSTVYESSLEYVRSCTDEHISASEFTATLSGDFNTAGEAMNSKIVSFKHSTTVGGVFETDEHSDEEKAGQNSKESVQLLSNAGAENESTRDVEKAMKDPAVPPGFVPEETAEAIGKPVDTNDSLPCEIQTNAQEANETNISEAFNDWTTTREASNENVAVMKDMGVPLQVREEVGEKQDIPQSNSCRYVTEDTSDEKKPRGLKARSLDEEYTKRHEKEQRGLKARSLDEENIKRRDTSVLDDSANDVVPEVHERKIENTYESLQENRQVLEQDEVATMDFSDEDERSLEDMRAHEHVVSVDVHEIPILHESDDVGNAETAKESEREKTILNGSSSVVTTTDVADKEDNNATEKTNRSQQDVEVPVQNVEFGTEETTAITTQDHVENSDAEGLSEKPQRTIGAIKTAVMVHDETKLEALECSEDLLQSVATEADFPSDIYEHADDDTDAGIGETNGEQPAEGLPLASDYVQSTHGDQRVPTEEHEGLYQVDASNQAKQRDEDAEVPHNRSSSDAVEDAIVPEHIQSPSNKSSTESESVSEKQDVVSNGGLKCAVEDFTRLISPDGDDIQASKKKGDEKGRIHDAAVIAEPSDDKVDPEVAEGERGDKNRERNAAGAKEDRKADNGDQEDSLKTDSSESFDLSAAGADDNDSGSRNVKENTTHKVTEAVEQSERTEGGATGDQVRSTRIFQKTVKRTESTRTVRRTRSFLPYTKWIRGETRQRARQETRDEDDATEPVEETLVAPQQAFPAMSIPRRGLCPMPESSPGNVCSVAVQAFPSVVDQGVQVEFDEPDCITRLVELQIAMNEQEEVRRQDMKAACELVEKLEAMQLSESLMRTQLRAMDAERREQSAREARLRDELTAWQETVQQQQLLLQQLKEDLDDTEDTLAAQRQEANRLREQMLVLQESCDSGLLMVDVLGRADKEVQTPDGGQQSLSSSSPYKGIRLDNSSPVYLDQLSQHRRLSALVSSQLEATANRIAQLRREAATNRPRGSTIDDYVQDLAVRTPDDLTRRPDASPSESAGGT